jgi:hypothetical protein
MGNSRWNSPRLGRVWACFGLSGFRHDPVVKSDKQCVAMGVRREGHLRASCRVNTTKTSQTGLFVFSGIETVSVSG